MKFKIPGNSLAEARDRLNAAVDKSNLQVDVSLRIRYGKLYVYISKMGTTELVFSPEQIENFVVFTLSSQQIGFFHQDYVGLFKGHINNFVYQAGGMNVT